jgi:hypothetical protein
MRQNVRYIGTKQREKESERFTSLKPGLKSFFIQVRCTAVIFFPMFNSVFRIRRICYFLTSRIRSRYYLY